MPCTTQVKYVSQIPFTFNLFIYFSEMVYYKTHLCMTETLYIPQNVLLYGSILYISHKVLVYSRTLYIPYTVLSMVATLYILYSWCDIRLSRRWIITLPFKIKRRVVWHTLAFREQPVAYIFTPEVSSPKQIEPTIPPHGR